MQAMLKASYQGQNTDGIWSQEEPNLRKNAKVLLATLFDVQSFAKDKSHLEILLKVEFFSAMNYKIGGRRSLDLYEKVVGLV